MIDAGQVWFGIFCWFVGFGWGAWLWYPGHRAYRHYREMRRNQS